MARDEGTARAMELAETLEAMAKRFERGLSPRVQDVRYIRKASVALARLAGFSEALREATDRG
jgi:hypothetical protein